MKFKIWMLGLGMVLAAGAAQASKTDTVIKAEDKEDFAASVQAIHKMMDPGGRYEYVTKDERGTIDARFGEMQSLFDKYGEVSKMDKDTKVKLLNDQEEVNAVLTKRDSKRVVCERVAPTGSLLPKSTCRTYGEIEANRRDAEKFMQNNQQLINTQKGG